MLCPYCTSESQVVNSRHQKRLNSVWRRRQCVNCRAIWTTSEQIKGSSTFKVQQDGKLVDFAPEMLLISLYGVLKHRKNAEIDAQYIQSTVIRNIQLHGEAIIPVEQIANESIAVLQNFDKLARDLYKTLHPNTV